MNWVFLSACLPKNERDTPMKWYCAAAQKQLPQDGRKHSDDRNQKTRNTPMYWISFREMLSVDRSILPVKISDQIERPRQKKHRAFRRGILRCTRWIFRYPSWKRHSSRIKRNTPMYWCDQSLRECQPQRRIRTQNQKTEEHSNVLISFFPGQIQNGKLRKTKQQRRKSRKQVRYVSPLEKRKHRKLILWEAKSKWPMFDA